MKRKKKAADSVEAETKKQTKKQKKDTEKKEAKNKKRLEEIHSTQMFLPIADIKDGIIITKDHRFVMLMEFAPINFSLRTEEERDMIASAFGAILKAFPQKIQIKVLSRKADVTKHIQVLTELIDQEDSEACRIMQQQTIDLIRNNAESGISKRFFVSFEYLSGAGLHAPQWSEICDTMYSTANRIASMLSAPPCGNALLSPVGDSDAVLDILYNCICRKQAEYVPCLTKCKTVIQSFLEQGRAKPGQYIPVADFLAPMEIAAVSPRVLKIDDKYYIFGYINGNSYDTACVAGWVTGYLNLGAGIDVDIFISKENPEAIQNKQVYMRRFNNIRLASADSSNADVDDLAKQVQSGDYIRQQMSNREEFCYFSILLTITADSEEELKDRIRHVRTSIITQGQMIQFISFMQEEAFLSALPLCNPSKYITKNGRRNAVTCDLGSIYPFTSYELNDAGGILLGNNLENYSPVFVNAFDKSIYENANTAIMGSSGNGKTYLSQLIMLRLRQQRVKTIVIAPIKGHEYRRSCTAVGGEYIPFSPGLNNVINIMEIRKVDHTVNNLIDGNTDVKSQLSEKIPVIQGFISLICPNMTATEVNALHDAITKTYAEFGITTRNKSLIDPKDPSRYKKMPILSDLYTQLRQNRASLRIADALSPYVRDTIKCFNGQTNVDLTAMSTVLDLSGMKDSTKQENVADLRTLAMYIAVNFVYDILQEDRTERKAVLFDEIWQLIGSGANRFSAEFILEIAKTVRALNTMAIFTTQDISDFFALEQGKYGKGILNNCKIKFVFGISLKEELERIVRELSLSDSERQDILEFQRGEALLIANRNHIKVKVKASDYEDMICTSDPDSLRKYYLDGIAQNAESDEEGEP